MKGGFERRQHIRAPLTLKVVLKTPHTPIKGKTADISIRGLSIMLFEKAPAISDEFKITIKLPSGHIIPILCKKAWLGKRISNNDIYDAIGVRFTNISPSDSIILATLIEDHYLIKMYKKYYPK